MSSEKPVLTPSIERDLKMSLEHHAHELCIDRFADLMACENKSGMTALLQCREERITCKFALIVYVSLIGLKLQTLIVTNFIAICPEWQSF